MTVHCLSPLAEFAWHKESRKTKIPNFDTYNWSQLSHNMAENGMINKLRIPNAARVFPVFPTFLEFPSFMRSIHTFFILGL